MSQLGSSCITSRNMTRQSVPYVALSLAIKREKRKKKKTTRRGAYNMLMSMLCKSAERLTLAAAVPVAGVAEDPSVLLGVRINDAAI